MFKGRTGLLILIVIVVAAILYLLLWKGGGVRLSPDQPQTTLPVDLQQIIPAKWQVITGQFTTCDFDGDKEAEWLVIYQYDVVTSTGRSLIGGAIYDAQANHELLTPENASPYPAASLIPYKLLPDIYTGKGQGYLGETKVSVNFFPSKQTEQTCQVKEITIQGFSDASMPTRLSIFQWGGQGVGYIGSHFVGNARIEAGDGTVPITQTLTYNRLNDRSALCVVQRYTRPPSSNKDAPPGIAFTEDSAAYTIDFCFGAPDDPAYPEGAVVALLRGKSPKGQKDSPSPTGETYLTANASLSGLERLKGASPKPLRILSVTTEGSLAPASDYGAQCTPAELSASVTGVWWCGRERAKVYTEIILDDQHRVATWHLLSIANDRVNADVHWRIERVDLQ